MKEFKKCKKCCNDFTPEKGLINYCSLQCRNSRTWTKEDNEKKSKSHKESEKVKKAIEDRKVVVKNRTPEQWQKILINRRKNLEDKLLVVDFSDLKFERMRNRIIIEQNYTCNNCNLDKWMGVEIALEIDHIDGDNKNNSRDNLVAICPNCHSLTKTWRGRNKKQGIGKVPDEVLLNVLIDNSFNMRQSLLSIGLSAKGGNYKRCHKLIKEYNETK